MVRVSGLRRSAPLVASVDPTQHTAFEKGLSPTDVDAGFQTAFGDAREGSQRTGVTIGNADRPSNVWYRMNGQSTYWYMYALMDWYRSEVSILSTLQLRFVSELCRYDLEFRPKFALKCVDCGYESDLIIDTCPVCKGHRLRGPDTTQKKYFTRPNGKSFIEEANDSGQSLKEVLRAFAESEFLYNQGYLLCVTGDVYEEETGKRLRNYPLEFLAYDPKFVKYLYDETGKPGRLYGFTMEDRNTVVNLNTSPNVVDFMTADGKEIYPAAWQIGSNYGGSGKYFLYTADEVYQDHWFRSSVIYGVPTWYDIEDDLLTYHYIEKHNLKKYKYGYVRKILVLPGFNDEDVEDITKGIQDILAKNDNSIPIVCTPPQMQNVAEMRAQTLELGTESSADLLSVKKDIMDRVCAHGGMPNIFMGDVEASGGMNNESQQITILDRYLLGPYNAFDRACRWFMSWFDKVITDWELCIMRPSKAYTDVKRRMDRAQEAQMMKSLGFDIHYRFGEFWYSSEPVDQVQRKEQEAMQKQQMMAQMQAEYRGLLPGDGDGPPEKGTARREDGDIDAAKDEVDLAKRESDDAQEM